MARRLPRPATTDAAGRLNEAVTARFMGARAALMGDVPDMAERSLQEAQAIEEALPLAMVIEAYARRDAVEIYEATTIEALGAAWNACYPRWCQRALARGG